MQWSWAQIIFVNIEAHFEKILGTKISKNSLFILITFPRGLKYMHAELLTVPHGFSNQSLSFSKSHGVYVD